MINIQLDKIIQEYMSQITSKMPHGIEVNTFSNTLIYLADLIKRVESHSNTVLKPIIKAGISDGKLVFHVEFEPKEHDGHFTYEPN